MVISSGDNDMNIKDKLRLVDAMTEAKEIDSVEE